MQREEFDLRVRMLLPQASEAALESYALLAEDPEVEETMRCSTFYDSLYVDLALVKRDHGEAIATDLFNYAETYTFNPFELRGAARLIADGWKIPEIANHMIEHGGEEPFCEYPPEEEMESEALLWLFQNKAKTFGDLCLPDPPPQEQSMEMG